MAKPLPEVSLSSIKLIVSTLWKLSTPFGRGVGGGGGELVCGESSSGKQSQHDLPIFKAS